MERKLASIQRIKELEPIENADAIDKVRVLGWQLVVKKGEFEIGDLCVYCEVDSLLPEIEAFEFLRQRKFRIRTIKLRGVISQGIAFPISILENFCKKVVYDKKKDMITITKKQDSEVIEENERIITLTEYEAIDLFEGDDVSKLMDIKKYEAPIPAQLSGKVVGAFPSFIPKTDETRIQTVPLVLDRHREDLLYITEKIDGTSGTYFIKDGKFGVCSRNWQLADSEKNTFWIVAKSHEIEEKLRKTNKNIAIQGEILGHGIQKNKYRFNQPEIFIFNVFDIDEYRYYNFEEMKEFCEEYGFKTVPILNEEFSLKNESVDNLVNNSLGISQLNKHIQREGLVIRSIIEATDEELGRLSFKVINPKFLLKYNE